MRSLVRTVLATGLAVTLLPGSQAGSEEGGKGAPAVKMTTYYLCLLAKGPRWTAEETADGQRLQEAHMANIRRLAETGALVLAGPLEDAGDLRGVFVFKVGSLEEARRLAEGDPAVQAGRLKAQVSTWWLPEGALPSAAPRGK